MKILRRTKRFSHSEIVTSETIDLRVTLQIHDLCAKLVTDGSAQNYDEAKVLITNALNDISIQRAIVKSAKAQIKHKKIGFVYGAKSIFKNINPQIETKTTNE